MLGQDVNSICIVCRKGGEESYAQERFRSLLFLPPFAAEVHLTTRYYSATAKVDLVLCNSRNGESHCSGKPEKSCETLVSLQRCQAVLLFAEDFRQSLVDVQDMWTSISSNVGEDCVRLLVVGGRIESECSLTRLLQWSVEAGIEVLCDDTCDEGMTVEGRLSDALQCADWPIRNLSQETASLDCSSQPVKMAQEQKKIKDDELVFAGNRVRKPILRSDVDVLTQALLALVDGCSDEGG